MASSLKCGSYLSGFNETMLNSNSNRSSIFCTSSSSALDSMASTSIKFPPLSFDFGGKPLVVPDSRHCSSKQESRVPVQAETGCVPRSMRWWEKDLKPNMVKINSAQELVSSLHDAGDRLVIVNFFKPGCGGCKTLHPKICQLAERNPNAIFLEVNYEQLYKMCQCLRIHVLPFFRFYRGAEGRLCSFSCTNATIKKFKDALAKHGNDRCSLGPAKGLDESELMELVLAGELQLPPLYEESNKDLVIMGRMELSSFLNRRRDSSNPMQVEKETALL